VENKLITGIVESAFSNHGKSLARRTPEYHIDIRITKIRSATDLRASRIHYARANDCCIREIVFMRCAMNGVNFNGSSYIESRLFEA
jgi:hypothetical protein